MTELDNKQFKNKLVVVTGGSRGIGAAIATKFSSLGANIAINSVEESADEALAQIKSHGVEAVFDTINVTDSNQVKTYFDKIIAQFGKVDVLINNAGITRDNLMIRMREEEFDSVIAVNLKGTYNCCQAVIRNMMKNRAGSIVNIASVIGLVGNVGQVNYAASKAGVIALTKSMARELSSRSIRVNAIAPGFIDTLMTQSLPENIKEQILKGIPLNSLGKPSDIANAAAFLASDEAAYITGQVLAVDGGMVM